MLVVLVGLGGIAIGLAAGWWLARFSAGAARRRLAESQTSSVAASANAANSPSPADAVVPLDAQAVSELAARLGRSHLKLQQNLPFVESRLLAQMQNLEASLAQVRVDGLTGLADQHAFEAELCRRLAEWRRKQTSLAVMRIDVDHFQRVNKQHGQEVGDALLRGVALVLRGALREMDLIARLGRDEFAVLLPQTTSRESAIVAKRVRAEMAAALFPIGELRLKLTVSVGAATAAPGDHVALLMERADAALHASKRGGRNAVHVYTRHGLKSIPAFEPEGFLATIGSPAV